MSKEVKVIPAQAEPQAEQVLRVAAYCRVSTDHEEQQTSLKSQVAYYTQKICETPEWDFSGIYAEQESGTSVEGRTELGRLLDDCRKGKVDVILTKSISRFGRNTRDTLLMINELNQLCVTVFFEIEGMNTKEKKFRQYIAMAAAAAQEESHFKSESIKWGIRQSSNRGHVKLNHTQFLGYGRDENGQLVVIDEEAKIVRLIFDLYLQGYGCRRIKRYLEEKPIPTVTGKSEWSTSTIDRILSNEKYVGCAHTQKTWVEDFLTHKQEKNTGNVTQLMLQNSHPAIISLEVFEAVQERKESGFSSLGCDVVMSQICINKTI